MIDEIHIAQKYARAFLQVYGAIITHTQIQQLKPYTAFLKEHRKVLFLVNLPLIDEEHKKKIIAQLEASCSSCGILEPLVTLLIKHRRIQFLPSILDALIDLDNERSEIIEFTVASVHPLDAPLRDTILQFLVAKTGKNIVLHELIDPTLIAGISAQSATLAWEFSVRKQLKQLKLT